MHYVMQLILYNSNWFSNRESCWRAVAIEVIFTMRGMGELLITSIHDKDIIVMQCAILVIGVSFALINLLVDIIYLLIDPRIRF